MGSSIQVWWWLKTSHLCNKLCCAWWNSVGYIYQVHVLWSEPFQEAVNKLWWEDSISIIISVTYVNSLLSSGVWGTESNNRSLCKYRAFCIVYYLDQQIHNIYINNEFLYRKYCYMFRCTCIIFKESYFPFAKVTKSIKSVD